MKALIFFVCIVALVAAKPQEDFRGRLVQNNFNSNDIVPKGTELYDELNFQFRLMPSQIFPQAYVPPKTEEDVVTIVRCGIKTKVRVVARSGGHQYEKYAYGNTETVVIDLQKMNQVTLNVTKTTAEVGSGSILGPTNWKLWSLGNVFFPNGLCPMVGIGGLAPGGGHGYFTRKYGLTTDYILEMNIVTASGELKTVNESTNDDLYWALRGGGGASFRIITKFVFKVLPTPEKIFVATMTYDFGSFPAVFAAWQQFFVDGTRKITPNFRIRDGGIDVEFFDCTGTDKAFRKMEKTFPASKLKFTGTYPYPNFIYYTSKNFGGSLKEGTVLDGPEDLENLTPGLSPIEDVKCKSFYVQKLLTQPEIWKFFGLLQTKPKWVRCRFEAYGGAVEDVGDTDTAFVHRKGRYYNARASADYRQMKTAKEKETAKGWLDNFYNTGCQIFKHNETYQNYTDGDIMDYLKRYYGVNLTRLVEVKKKYDPENYFYNPQSIPVEL